MASYFRNIPDFEYVSRNADTKNISEYQKVKNLFKRGKLKNDIFNDLTYFTKYLIIGDDRPDNVAYNVYNDEQHEFVLHFHIWRLENYRKIDDPKAIRFVY